MLVRVSDTTPFSWLFAAYVAFGIGFGFVNAPITNAAVSGMPRAQAGVASAIASTSRQIGATLGVAVVGALVTSKVGAVTGGVNLDFAEASRAGWWVLAGCGAVVLALGLVVTSQRARASAPADGRRSSTPSSSRGSGDEPDEAVSGAGRMSPADEAWEIMRELVLDNERRREVSDALGMSFARAKALRRIYKAPSTMGELATSLVSIRPT